MSDTTTAEHTVRATVAEVLGVTAEALAADPVLATHHWDSLSSLYAFTELESRTGVVLDLRTFHTARTVDDLVGLVGTAAGQERAA